jgi:hypothetical protein
LASAVLRLKVKSLPARLPLRVKSGAVSPTVMAAQAGVAKAAAKRPAKISFFMGRIPSWKGQP